VADPKRYWKPVLILTVVFLAVAALACWVVPRVRDGTVPAVGGLIWHPLGAIQLLLTEVYWPIAARAGKATIPAVGVVISVVLTVGSALLLAMVIWLPFYLLHKRRSGS
jgi:hypothetical protein